MKMTQKDLQNLIELGAVEELTSDNVLDAWYNVVCCVYKTDGSLYAKVLVCSAYERSEISGKWFVVRGCEACSY